MRFWQKETKKTVWQKETKKTVWQSSPAGDSPGLLALDLACESPRNTLPTAYPLCCDTLRRNTHLLAAA
jgi:hypothetical protein